MQKQLRYSGLGLSLIALLSLLLSGLGSVTAINKSTGRGSSHSQGDPPPVAVVVNGGAERSISLIDSVTDTALGPFLDGMLGAPGTELLDCVVTPDGNTAVVSNSSSKSLFFIDLRSMPPSLLGSLTMPISPQDIALSPQGQFALVTGAANDVISVDVASRKVVARLTLTGIGQAHAVAVAIAPDGQTVLVADFAAFRISVLQLNTDGTLTQTRTTLGVDGRPANVTISPDGKTAVVSNALTEDNSNSDTVTILRIDGPTRVVKTGTIRGLPGLQQGAAFTPNGAKVLVLSLAPGPNRLSVLNVVGPGMVTDSKQRLDLLSNITVGFLGVDVVAVAPDGTKAYVGNSGRGVVASRVTVVDLTTTPPVLRSTIPMPVPYAIAFPGAGG